MISSNVQQCYEMIIRRGHSTIIQEMAKGRLVLTDKSKTDNQIVNDSQGMSEQEIISKIRESISGSNFYNDYNRANEIRYLVSTIPNSAEKLYFQAILAITLRQRYDGYDEAFGYLEQAIKLDSGNLVYRQLLGNMQRNLGA